MALVVLQESKPDLVKLMLSKVLTLRLFQNDKTPAPGDTATEYEEADFIGYLSIRLEPARWDVTRPLAVYDPMTEQTFISDADQDAQPVYGYFIMGGRKVRWAERFAGGPYVIQFFGDRIAVRPVFGLE